MHRSTIFKFIALLGIVCLVGAVLGSSAMAQKTVRWKMQSSHPALTSPGASWHFQLSIPTLPPLHHPRGVSFPLFGGHWHHPLSGLVRQDSWRGFKCVLRLEISPCRLEFYPNRAEG